LISCLFIYTYIHTHTRFSYNKLLMVDLSFCKIPLVVNFLVFVWKIFTITLGLMFFHIKFRTRQFITIRTTPTNARWVRFLPVHQCPAYDFHAMSQDDCCSDSHYPNAKYLTQQILRNPTPLLTSYWLDLSHTDHVDIPWFDRNGEIYSFS
jgi:hypothetical protein